MRVFSIGIDVHRRSWTVSVISEREIVFRGTLSPSWLDLVKTFERHGVTPANSRIAYEAGPTGFGLCDLLTRAGYDAIVVSPNRIPREAGPQAKTDRRDSLELARLLQGGLLRGIAVPSPQERAVRDLVRTRGRLVERRASLLRMAKMKMVFFGVDYGDRLWSKSFAGWVLEQPMPEECRTSIGHLFSVMNAMEREIDLLDEEIAEALHRHAPSMAPLYMSVPGIGPVVAATLVTELRDLGRFETPEKLVSFLGLLPR
jgi:transposase